MSASELEAEIVVDFDDETLAAVVHRDGPARGENFPGYWTRSVELLLLLTGRPEGQTQLNPQHVSLP